jgi:hypothetical protein
MARNRKGRYPARPHDARAVAYRSVSCRAEDASDESRSIKVTLASGEPVKVWDYERGLIDEYLDLRGAKLPKQVPLLDSHNR